MPTYVYKCPEHGRVDIDKAMRDAGRAEYCPACALAGLLNVEMARVYTAPRVQNLSASRDSLQSWGKNMRFEGTESLASKVRRHEAERRGEPGKAHTMTEEG